MWSGERLFATNKVRYACAKHLTTNPSRLLDCTQRIWRSIPATAAAITDDSAEPVILRSFFQWLNWRNFVIGFLC